jgi:cell division protein FtsB
MGDHVTMSANRRRQPPAPGRGAGGDGAPVSGPVRRGGPAAASGPAARRPGHARRLRVEAQFAEVAQRERGAQARRRRHIGFRIAMVAILAMFAFAVTFPTLRLYLADQQELQALRGETAAARVATDDLRAELARWEDPAFVQAQARARLSYVMPGDVAYRVVDPEKVETPAPAPTASVTPEAVRPLGGQAEEATPWYTALWTSAQVAGGVAPDGKPGEGADGGASDPESGAGEGSGGDSGADG